MVLKKILIIDDSILIAEYISKILTQAGYQTITAASGQEGIRKVKELDPDLVLLDVVLPDLSGFDVCGILRADTSNNLRPIIMLTSQKDENDKIKGLELGADDYITKPFNERELISRVNNTLKRIDRNRNANPLTGLEGNLRIESEISRRLTTGEVFSAMYFDLDNFKAYNDVYGFAKGDMIIKMASSVITGQFAKHGSRDDFVGHIGGDDFIAISKPEHVDDICKGVISEFDANIRGFYSEEHLRSGFIEAVDRRGNLNRYPIMTISIAVVSNENRAFESHFELARVAAELMKKVKCMSCSAYMKG
mgnify:CR=1 FL=1